MKDIKFKTVCPILISECVIKTVNFYTEKLGFKYAGHFDEITNSFATLYKDSIVLMVVEQKWGKIEQNEKKHGVRYDAYIFVDLDTTKELWTLYHDFLSRGIKIAVAPRFAGYTWEFVFEDIDGRLIAIGYIDDKEEYFKDSNVEY